MKLGLDIRKCESDLANDTLAQVIEADRREGAGVAITGTPTFFVNGYGQLATNGILFAQIVKAGIAVATGAAIVVGSSVVFNSTNGKL